MRHRPFLRRPATAALAALTAATTAVVGLAGGATAAAPAAPSAGQPADRPADGSSTHDADGVNGYKTLGYFPGWGPGDAHDYEVADLVRTGAAADLTHLTYAFGNVTSDLVCDISDAQGPEGDRENDYLRLIGARDSVDGVADSPDQALAGNFNQLRKLKEVYPDLKVMISLGGW
ncbi:glycosyl hydrolase family 18 protein, partial [Isoptericola hypogeus]